MRLNGVLVNSTFEDKHVNVPVRQLRRMKRTPWTILILCFFMFSCIAVNVMPASKEYQTGQMVLTKNQSIDRHQSQYMASSIHLFLVIQHLSMLNKAITMCKSLFYHQGRFNKTVELCKLELEAPVVVGCTKHRTSKPESLILHLAVHKAAWKKTASMFSEWNTSDLIVKMYPFKKDLTFRGTELENNLKVQVALQHLLVPYILDDSVKKVIVLNPNLLFNENIEELWEHFNRFTPKQAIGAVCEQAEECPDCCPRGQQTFPLYGINAGLMLLHLSKLRRINWRHLFKTEFDEEQYLREEPGDLNQGILNLLLSKRVPMLYQLPCEWNVQARNSGGVKACPVYWNDQSLDKTECGFMERSEKPSYVNNTLEKKNSPEERNSEMVRVVQYDILKKDDFTIEDEEDGDKLQPIKLGPLRYKFHVNYRYFQQLPLKCFVNQRQQTSLIGSN
ncbi:Glycosyltransferase protein LARGE [Paragonimus skrjabini miyazakii]|uniref:Glycosyltransferase protein LARGE n=1 Tax=Paragonimus skrjabini miyazakii TaxID=59628 RepID=A0A8S9Z3Y5_9TREM|nr:Glycosyltransferase protein LARGE [Paragonimus skrjabini miyazakii]